MKLLKVAAAALNQTPLDWDGNRQRIVDVIAQARQEHVGLLCLPELCITGYGCEDAFYSAGVHQMAWQVLGEIAPATRGMAVTLGLPLLFQHRLFNAAALLVDGELAGLVGKQFLPSEGVHYEPRWFRGWPPGRRVMLERDGREYPWGDVHFDINGIKVGFEICEDAWVAKRPGSELSLHGVDVILNPSASHFAFGKAEIRRRTVLEGSRAFGVTYVYANLLGNEAGRVIYDGGTLIASAGRLVAAGPRLAFGDGLLTSGVVDLDATRMQQARSDYFEAPSDAAAVRVAFEFPAAQPSQPVEQSAAWETSPHLKEEEFTRAIALGLFDYLRKSRSRGLVVSISGGADSAAVTCLAGLMTELAAAELGMDGLKHKLAYLPELAAAKTPREITRQLLTCVYQSTRNSSDTTRNAARGVAEAVGADFLEFDVDSLAQGYVDMVSKAIGRKLDWQHDDVALQNIQARTRSPGIWLLANLRGALLLSTSNRSEAAVGYATMDGDTSGGLSPIAGIDKAYLRRWLVWLEKRGPAGAHAIPALAAVNVQAPTAELRPAGAGQTDEQDLMPYELLDAIERAAIGEKHTPLETYLQMRSQFPQYSAPQLGVWVERFFRLWCRNQWKRERYAPSFHLDDQNLDPKTWCRFPILSGGFERELADLRAYLARSTKKPS